MLVSNTVSKFVIIDISCLCSERRTILCSNSLNLSLDEVFQSVPSPDRSMGLRFLYPVYLIDRVEMTTHSSTSTSTVEKGVCVCICADAS